MKEPKKVEITITEGHKYSITPYNSFIDVSFSANTYGMGCPCDNAEQVKRAVEHAKEWIKREGDIPVLKDLRKCNTLLNWAGVR